ncbi:hypothetical protein [Arthrobacter sp. E3]|uniref:hypothetical protein n=1 Tax=Arthrobacter sp. E3 TaxID=517402 RepID=UPI001A9456C2|nr:hypothetical protein [Arthrobacter sp. E3]
MTTTTTELADKCLDFIRNRRHVTFVELGEFLETNGIDPRGDGFLELNKCSNLVMWAGMSATFMDVVVEIHRRDVTQLDPTIPLTYAIDGGMLTLPVAKRLPKNGYKKQHWAPVVFNMKAAIR